jgi:hypothetical protein
MFVSPVNNSNKYLFQAEIKSIPDHKRISPKQINMYLFKQVNTNDYLIHVNIPRIRKPIPIGIVFEH